MNREWIFPCEFDENYDGDTFKLRVELGFALSYFISARLHGADTPEMRGGTILTKAAACLAKDEAAWFIKEAHEVLFHCTVWGGKYGRPVGDIICDGQSLAKHLINLRLAVPYDGGSRKTIFSLHEVNAVFLKEEGRLDPYLSDV